MPQVDYRDIPFNETAETRRRSQNNNQQTRIDSIIEDITRARQNRPRINSNDVFRGSAVARTVDSGERSFIQRHPFLFGITLLILVLAIVSMNSAVGDNNYVNSSHSARNIQQPAKTVSEIPIYIGWEEKTIDSEQNTYGQETEAVTPTEETETDGTNNVNTEMLPSVNEHPPAQLAEKQPRWMTDPPDVFMRTRYVK